MVRNTLLSQPSVKKRVTTSGPGAYGLHRGITILNRLYRCIGGVQVEDKRLRLSLTQVLDLTPS